MACGPAAGVQQHVLVALQASAVVDRIRRALATTSDNVSSRIGPIAKSFGQAFGVDDWCASLPVQPLALTSLPHHTTILAYILRPYNVCPCFPLERSRIPLNVSQTKLELGRYSANLVASLNARTVRLGRYVELFAEEVVRGGPAFAVSLVLSSLEPTLRAAAELGAWQIISPVNALGRVEVVGGLHEVQDKVRWPAIFLILVWGSVILEDTASALLCITPRTATHRADTYFRACAKCSGKDVCMRAAYCIGLTSMTDLAQPGHELIKKSSYLLSSAQCRTAYRCDMEINRGAVLCAQRYEEPTVLLAKRVTGEEEVPEGCVAVVTPDAPDVLSHVSVRARNMRVLFAICHEEEPLQQIEALNGKVGGTPTFRLLPSSHATYPFFLCKNTAAQTPARFGEVVVLRRRLSFQRKAAVSCGPHFSCCSPGGFVCGPLMFAEIP